MTKDIYVEKVTNANIENGIVTIGCGVATGSVNEETIRLRIPLAKYQEFASRLRDTLLAAMRDGWYGDDGVKAAEALKEGGR